MRLASVSALVVAAGVGLGAFGLLSPSHVQPPSPRTRAGQALPTVTHRVPTNPRSPATPAPAPAPASSASLEVASAPSSIAFPALGIASNLGPARGLDPDGTIDDAPLSGPTWSLPWWYENGPAPGQGGSAVLLGHVDSAVGAGHLGVFFRLGEATPGEVFTVTLANGAVTSWDVTSVRLYSDSQFPDALVYGRSGPPTLRLVTCGGAFDYQSHAYQSAVVVTAQPVRISSTSPAP